MPFWPSSFCRRSLPLDAQATEAAPPAAAADIGTSNFSTGVLGPGSSSLIYKTRASPGMFVFGDRNYYGSSNMRTVVIAM